MIFKLFSNCKIVNGKFYASICDLQRSSFLLIPLELSTILVESEITTKLLNKNKTLKEWIKFLEGKNLGFWSESHENFLDLNETWETPEIITNAIVEMDLIDVCFFSKILHELNILKCKFIELRFYSTIDMSKLLLLLSFANQTVIRNIILVVKYSSELSLVGNIDEIFEYCNRIGLLVIHTCPSDYSIVNSRVTHLEEPISNSNHCGIINYDYFAINIPTYTESLRHNSCLNRKISIDIEGNIKNCPSMTESFGNIRDTTLVEAIEKPGFKKYWDINKDKIHVCKDCEFRYICTDCRAYVEDPEDILSKPLKCGYNPYTGEWSEWSTNPLKQKAIDFYGMREMVDEMNKADSTE